MENQIVVPSIAVGRRKEAVARIRLIKGNGKILVNSKPLENYFPSDLSQKLVKQPLAITANLDKYDIFAKVRGGGITGQIDAIRLGIARALMIQQPELKEVLRKSGLLTRDPRMKERKKYGQKGARKRFQWTKR